MTLRVILIILLVIISLMLISMIIMVALKGRIAEKKYFILLLIAITLYSAGYCIEICGSTVEWVFAAYKIQYIGISFLPAFLILFALSYSKKSSHFPKTLTALIFIIPVITCIIAYTDSYHSLLHANPRMDVTGPFPVLDFDRGAWYWVHIAFINISLFIANIIFLNGWLKTRARYRSQAAILFFSSLIPWIVFIIYVCKLIHWSIDITPFAFTITSLFLYWGITKKGLADIVPIARDMVFENISDLAIVIDNYNSIIDYNKSAEEIFDIAENIVGQDVTSLFQRFIAISEFEAILSGKSSAELKIKDYTFIIRIIPLKKGLKQIGKILLLSDISEYKILMEQLKELSITDELTSIANRRYFFETASRELARARRVNRPFSIIIFDLDHFKNINDTYGHLIGDDILKEIAQKVISQLRTLDIYARYGGEEFIICLPETMPNDAVIVAERIRNIVEECKFKENDHLITVTISLGIASLTDTEEELEMIIKHADEALYHAKQSGRNRAVVYKKNEYS